MKYLTLVIIIILLGLTQAKSQEPILERRLTISLGKISKYEALKRISHEMGIGFSYKEGVLMNNEIVCIEYKDVPLELVLKDLFNDIEPEITCIDKVLIIRPRNGLQHNKRTTAPVNEIKSEPEVMALPINSDNALQKLEPKLIQRIIPEDTADFLSIIEQPFIDCFTEDSVSKRSGSVNRRSFFTSGNGQRKDNITDINARPKSRVSSNKLQTEILPGSEYCYDSEGPGGVCRMKPRLFSYKTGLGISPHFSITSQQGMNWSIHGGILQDICYKQKYSISTGIQFSTQSVKINAGTENDVWQKATIKYFSVPVSISVSLYHNNSNSIFFSAGNYNYLFSNRGLPYAGEDPHIEWIPYVNFSFGFERYWFSDLSWCIEPFCRFPVQENKHFESFSKVGVTLALKYIHGAQYNHKEDRKPLRIASSNF